MLSFQIDQLEGTITSMTLNDQPIAAPFDVIWARRKGRPQASADAHPDDTKIIKSEASEFINNLAPFLGHANTRYVNDFDADRQCFNKLYQLKLAREQGFAVPDTLVSNDPGAIRSFFRKNAGQVIVKAFSPAVWPNPDGSRTVQRTSMLLAQHLESEFALRACPAIYQAHIEKAHELRVTVMGDEVLAARIDSQADGQTVDWRYEGGRGKTNLSATTVDRPLRERCVDLCRRLGLAYAAIDLIVTPAGDVVFLEINNTGQFTFKEVSDPTIPMLDTFCRFLLGLDASASKHLTLAACYQALENECADQWERR